MDSFYPPQSLCQTVELASSLQITPQNIAFFFFSRKRQADITRAINRNTITLPRTTGMMIVTAVSSLCGGMVVAVVSNIFSLVSLNVGGARRVQTAQQQADPPPSTARDHFQSCLKPAS